jgi:NCS1 family nucleobase:cation symporter-1
VADYSRYLPARTGTTATFIWTYAGIVISTAWLSILGVVLAHWYPKLDLLGQVVTPAHHLGTGFRDVVLVTIALGLIGVNSLNIYGASLSTLTIVTSLTTRWRSSVALRFSFIFPITVGSTYLAFLQRANVLTFFQNILSFLLYFLIPWTAINLIDFYFIRRGRYDVDSLLSRSGPYGKVSWIGLTAYLIGCLAETPFVNTTVFVGPAASALGGGDISWIVGIVFGGGSYLALHRSPVGRYAPFRGRGQRQAALPGGQEPAR